MDNKILIDPSEDRINIAKKVSKLALPIIFSNLLYTVETSVSLILVSGISSTAVAGVGYSNSMLWFIYSLMALSYTGTSVLVAQRVGAGKDPSPAFLWGLILAFLIALPLTFFGTDITTAIMMQFGASKEVAEVSHQYLEPIFLFITVGFIIEVFYAAYNGYGDTKTPFKIGFFMSLIDVVFSYLLIYGKFGLPRLEVAGAGWGIVLSEIYGLLAYLYLYIAHRRPFPVRLDVGKDVLLKILRIGSPTALERAITSLSFNIFVGMIARFGDKALAAHQVGLRVESVSFMVGFGFMIASTIVSGQNFGAGNYKGLQRGISTIAHLTALIMGLAGVFLLLFPREFSYLFVKDPEVVDLAVYYLVIVALSQPQMAYASVYSGALKGMGKTYIPLMINISSFWLFRIIPSYVFLKLFPSPIVPWVFMSVETTLRALIFYLAYRRIISKLTSPTIKELPAP
ncbi:MATE family efflux transporter [Thermocrinis sp.]|jgi:putative MATE family efflux protein|uniref:MATE family efflux transporter n=1 Tax=Thermocrinis sp. TaxID=2024383 RepID=UPI00262C3483|nr:MATE family efflux transporter [Thermocrinis sp.]